MSTHIFRKKWLSKPYGRSRWIPTYGSSVSDSVSLHVSGVILVVHCHITFFLITMVSRPEKKMGMATHMLVGRRRLSQRVVQTILT